MSKTSCIPDVGHSLNLGCLGLLLRLIYSSLTPRFLGKIEQLLDRLRLQDVAVTKKASVHEGLFHLLRKRL